MVSNSALQNSSNANRFHYKTPNLSDRLKSEQLHEEMTKVIFNFRQNFDIEMTSYNIHFLFVLMDSNYHI